MPLTVMDYDKLGAEEFWNRLRDYFFNTRVTLARYDKIPKVNDGWITGSTWRGFRHVARPKIRGHCHKVLREAADKVIVDLSTKAKSITSITEYDDWHNTCLETIFHPYVISKDVNAKTGAGLDEAYGPYAKTMNLAIWHYLLGTANAAKSPSWGTHLKNYLHPCFDKSVLRGLRLTVVEDNSSSPPSIPGWTSNDARMGIIKSQSQYAALLEFVRDSLPSNTPPIVVDGFWGGVSGIPN